MPVPACAENDDIENDDVNPQNSLASIPVLKHIAAWYIIVYVNGNVPVREAWDHWQRLLISYYSHKTININPFISIICLHPMNCKFRN